MLKVTTRDFLFPSIETVETLLGEFDPIYKKILKVALLYYARARWFDSIHILVSTSHLVAIVKNEIPNDLDQQKILIPAFLFHDVGWAMLGEEKHTRWNDPHVRVKHMMEGKKIARKHLKEIGYPEDLLSPIVNLISTHDNEYLGQKEGTQLGILHRDADTSFILTYPSFWKDYVIRCVLKQGIYDYEQEMISKSFLQQQFEKYGPTGRHTQTAKSIVENEVRKRREETDDPLINPMTRFEELKKAVEVLNATILNTL